MKAVFILAILAVSAFAREDWEVHYEWEKFRSEFKRVYNSAGHAFERFNVFRDNLRQIDEHNDKGLSYFLRVNEFADLTNEEWNAQKASCFLADKPKGAETAALNTNALPESVDWVSGGAVTPVKNQGSCGSCWAFSTTGSTEGANAIFSKKLVSLSEQQLVDCGAKEGSHGCQGGLMDFGFQYILDNKGICSEADYPYEGKGGTCRSTSCTNAVEITSFTDVKQASEIDLQAAVAQQPVSVAVDAASFWWQFYGGGVFKHNCGTSLDHGVLAVGYGTDKDLKYWKVKNSWAETWGEKGYIRLERGKGGKGECGIAAQPSYPNQ